MEIRKLKYKEEWEKLLNNSSEDYEIIIFKHSPICSLSHTANFVIKDWSKSQAKNKDKLKIYKVNVILSKTLCETIEKDLNVIHQSPQIIWLDKKMKVKHHASHHNITRDELTKWL